MQVRLWGGEVLQGRKKGGEKEPLVLAWVRLGGVARRVDY